MTARAGYDQALTAFGVTDERYPGWDISGEIIFRDGGDPVQWSQGHQQSAGVALIHSGLPAEGVLLLEQTSEDNDDWLKVELAKGYMAIAEALESGQPEEAVHTRGTCWVRI